MSAARFHGGRRDAGLGGPDEDRTGGFDRGGWAIPAMTDPSISPIAAALNSRPKYVPSPSLAAPQWAGTTVLTGDVAAAIGDLNPG